MEKKTYTVKVKCMNCGQYTSNIEIEKGTKVYRELQFRECPVCGCTDLEMVRNELTWTNTNSTGDVVSTDSYTPDLEPFLDFISQELGKAREEGEIEVLTEIFQTCYQEDSKTRELVEEKLSKLKQ